MDLWGPWLQIKLGANAVEDLLTACVNQTIINLPQIRNRRIRVLQDILDGGHCVMRAAGWHARLHEVLRSALQEWMGAASYHSKQIHVVRFIIGEMRNWTESWFTFFGANQ